MSFRLVPVARATGLPFAYQWIAMAATGLQVPLVTASVLPTCGVPESFGLTGTVKVPLATVYAALVSAALL